MVEYKKLNRMLCSTGSVCLWAFFDFWTMCCFFCVSSFFSNFHFAIFFSEDTTMSHGPSQHYKERRNMAPSTGIKLIAGGLAGIITKTSTAPLERYLYFRKDLSTIAR